MEDSVAQILNELKLNRQTFNDQLTHYKNTIKSCRENGDIEKLISKIEHMKKVFANFNDNEHTLLCSLKDTDTYKDEKLDIEDDYINTLAIAHSLVQKANTRSPTLVRSVTKSKTQAARSNQNANQTINLPPIALPIFSGRHVEWLSFANQFKSRIHENRFLDDFERLHYLKSYLQGEPASMIAFLPICASNYPVAWSILEEYYNMPSLIVEEHLRAIHELKKMKRATYTDMLQFLNIAETHCNALDKIDQPLADTLIIYILASRLDKETYTKWCEDPRSKGFPTRDQFFSFLRERRNILKYLSLSASRVTAHTQENTATKNNSTNYQSSCRNRVGERQSSARPREAFSTTANIICSICGAKHFTYKCMKLIEATIEKRREMVQKAKLCQNCLRANHDVSECKSVTCNRCNLLHHTLLHNETASSAPVLSIITTSFFGSTQRYDLLPTAVVQLQNGNRTSDSRVLISNGSEVHLISESMVKILNLQQKQVNVSIRGLYNTRVIRYSVKLRLRSLRTDFSEEIEFFVLPNMLQITPARNVDRSKLEIPSVIKLADPQFDKSAPIDAIIGIQLSHKLSCLGRISLLDDSVSLLKTKLGWVVSGDMSNAVNKASRRVQS